MITQTISDYKEYYEKQLCDKFARDTEKCLGSPKNFSLRFVKITRVRIGANKSLVRICHEILSYEVILQTNEQNSK